MKKSVFEQKLQRTEPLRRLVALKKYERPDSAMEARLLRALDQRRDEMEEKAAVQAEAWTYPLKGLFPALRYGMAALFLALLAAYLVTVSRLPPVDTLTWELGEEAENSPEPAFLAEEFDVSDPAEEQILVIASNITPAAIRYGPQPSELVDY